MQECSPRSPTHPRMRRLNASLYSSAAAARETTRSQVRAWDAQNLPVSLQALRKSYCIVLYCIASSSTFATISTSVPGYSLHAVLSTQ